MTSKNLNLAGVSTADEFHSIIIKELGFPDYYGRNLDAFDECLEEFCSDTSIIVSGLETLNETLGNYISRYIDLMKEFEEKQSGTFSVTVLSVIQ